LRVRAAEPATALTAIFAHSRVIRRPNLATVFIWATIGAVAGYGASLALGDTYYSKFSTILGATLMAALAEIKPVLEHWLNSFTVRLYARSELAKHRAIEKARLGIGFAKSATQAEIIGFEGKVQDRRAQAFTAEAAMRMRMLVMLGKQTDDVLRDIQRQPWRPDLQRLIRKLVLIVAAGSRQVIAELNYPEETASPGTRTGIMVLLWRMLLIEILGVCIATPIVILPILAIFSFAATLAWLSLARWL
jgi:hypothetical protein